jgi:hypothetical protein
VINAVDDAVLGTIDLGGMPEQAVTDGKGHVCVDTCHPARCIAAERFAAVANGRYGWA